MNISHTAVIVGTGIGGIATANELRKRVSRSDRIVAIDRDATHLFAPSLLWLAVGDRTASDIRRPVRELVHPGVEFIQGTVESIDPATRSVIVDGASIAGDALVIALGAALAPQSVVGLAQAGHNLYDLAGAEALCRALRDFTGGRVVVLTAAALYKCPAAPYEASMLIDDALRRRGVRAKATLEMYAAEPGPMAVAGANVADAVKAMLRSKNIAYAPGRQVTSVDPASHTVNFSDGSSAEYDLLVYVPPHLPPKVVTDSGLGNETGWIPVDRSTLETKFEGVYAIGDVATIPLAIGKPLPKAGVFAHAEGHAVARNIADAWNHRPAAAAFDGRGACFLETGGSKAAMGSGDFFAEPAPRVLFKPPSRWLHLAKVMLEKRWLQRWPF